MTSPIIIAAIASFIWLIVLMLSIARRRISRTGVALLVLLPLLPATLYYFHAVVPAKKQAARLDAAQLKLATLPVWRTIATQQPVLYKQADIRLNALLQSGVSEQRAFDLLRPLTADLLNQRINASRDDDLNRYMKISLEEMTQLRKQSGDLCFRFLYPQVKGGVDATELLPRSLIEQEMLAMDQLLSHSEGTARPIDLSRGRQQLQSVVKVLYSRWGNDLQTLNTPAEKGIDTGKLCDMTIDLYQSVLALPDKDSANVLRIIISGTGN